ncbi:MAG: DUF262 domain-containing protein [Saprospiraceae bacterium]
MENSKTHSAVGKRLAFHQLFSKKGHDIEIPIIQRDYAQGRPGASVVRDLFLDALCKYLQENKPGRDLDFVYGSIGKYDANLFIPLDGQQRLTTLFLLHWYLANKEGRRDDLRELLQRGDKSRFRYETRTSASEFCDSLMNCDLAITELPLANGHPSHSVSGAIKNCNWYYLSWDLDPTIQAMLTMLDAIHKKFGPCGLLFDRLVNHEHPIITFHFLNLEDFELTDDLYVKMNARGKPLTPFENFKAKFEALLENLKFENAPKYYLGFNGTVSEAPVKKYFAHRIDTDWANLFWAYREEKGTGFDEMIMNFVYATALHHYVAKSDPKASDESIGALLRDKNKATLFHAYFSLQCFDEKCTTDLMALLDLLKNGDSKARRFLSDDFYYNERAEIKRVLDDGFDNFPQRIQFYAYCQYLVRWGNADGLFDWMRVIHNLSENTQYNKDEDFFRSIKSVKRLLLFSNNILSFLRRENPSIQGFSGDQAIEERIKSHLIGRGKQWEDAIYKAEHHGYFKGQIAFLLNFSGIEDYFSNNQHCNWSSEEDQVYYEAFNNYFLKSSAVFEGNGLRKFEEHIWERALLSKGDYLLREGSNKSFLIDNDRDISWKRLLKDDSEERGFVKKLLDDERFSAAEIESSLANIIEEATQIDDWREPFVILPKLIDYLGYKRYIRFYSEEKIYLLRGERMSGYHAEYYSYTLYVNSIENGDFSPFRGSGYEEVKGDDDNDQPCVVIYNWEYGENNFQIQISFGAFEAGFKIDIVEAEGNEFPEEIMQVLENVGFDEWQVFMQTEEEVLDLIGRLCNELKGLESV